MWPSRLKCQAQRHTRAQDVLLADHLAQVAWAQALGQWLVQARCGRGVRMNGRKRGSEGHTEHILARRCCGSGGAKPYKKSEHVPPVRCAFQNDFMLKCT